MLSITSPLAPPGAFADAVGTNPVPKLNPVASKLKDTMQPVPEGVQFAGAVVPVACTLMKIYSAEALL